MNGGSIRARAFARGEPRCALEGTVCSVRFHQPGARLVAASSASVGFFVMSMAGKNRDPAP